MLFDIDGTLAPIVNHASEASVPEATRKLMIAISRRYALLACVSGRRASDARAMVAIGTITYIGSHGAEVLAAGATSSVLDPELLAWVPKVEAFRRACDTPALQRRRVRVEDKTSMLAFHWRGAPDEVAAKAAVDALADEARRAGLEVHWGRKVMEVRPPVRLDKGIGIKMLLRGRALDSALYVGDDYTDLDAFRELRALVEAGELERAFCVGVRSEDGPIEIVEEADIVADGPDGVQDLLTALIAD